MSCCSFISKQGLCRLSSDAASMDFGSLLSELRCCVHVFGLGMARVDVLCCVCSATESWLTLCDPTVCSLLGSSVHGIFQARILESMVNLAFAYLFIFSLADYPLYLCLKLSYLMGEIFFWIIKIIKILKVIWEVSKWIDGWIIRIVEFCLCIHSLQNNLPAEIVLFIFYNC